MASHCRYPLLVKETLDHKRFKLNNKQIDCHFPSIFGTSVFHFFRSFFPIPIAIPGLIFISNCL